MHKHCYEIVEGDRYHRCGSDLVTRKDNVLKHGEESLCERCDGTGNELLGMYCECQACDGTGLSDDARQDDEDGGVRGRQDTLQEIEDDLQRVSEDFADAQPSQKRYLMGRHDALEDMRAYLLGEDDEL